MTNIDDYIGDYTITYSNFCQTQSGKSCFVICMEKRTIQNRTLGFSEGIIYGTNAYTDKLNPRVCFRKSIDDRAKYIAEVAAFIKNNNYFDSDIESGCQN